MSAAMHEAEHGGPARRASARRRAARTAALAILLCVAGCADDESRGERLPAASKRGTGPGVTSPGPSSALAGLWKRVRVRSSDPGLDDETRERVRRLESLGYVAGSVPADGDADGVTVHDPARAQDGLNFLTSGHAPGALLIDMRGRELHRWSASFRSLWPDSELRPPSYWRRAALLPDGGVIAVFEGKGIARLDRDSNVVWKSDLGAHHDLEVLPDGRVFVLTRAVNRVEGIYEGRPFLEDAVSVLDAQGRETRRLSVLQAMLDSPFGDHVDLSKSAYGDVLHTNALEVLDGSLARRVPAFAAGRVLVSLGVQNAIAVLDLDREQAVWAYAGGFSFQHDPRALPNGNLLLFDNVGAGTTSRILEIDPVTLERPWVYAGSPRAPFFSATCGTAQRLRNGNTLVTESDAGRAFEIEPDGTIVWEYRNPHRAGPDGEFVAALLEVERLPPTLPWLEAGDATP